jgi:hypothetical protein
MANLEITIWSALAFVPATVADDLRPLLRIRSDTFDIGGRYGVRRRRESETLLIVQGERAWFPVGLVDLVAEQLAHTGHTITVVDHRRFDKRLAPNLDARHTARPADRAIMERLSRNPRGILSVPSLNEKLHVIELICRLYSNARTLILTARSKDVGFFKNGLAARLGQRVATRRSWEFEQRGHMVASYRISDIALPEDWDVVVLTDATEACAPSHRLGVCRLGQKVIYGFVDDWTRMSHRMCMRLLALCGPVILGAVRAEQIDRRTVVWIPCDSNCLGATFGSCLAWKRSAIWQNASRNELISKVASAISRNDGPEMARLSNGILDRALGDRVGECRVAIIVECLEHARQLQKLLPAWRLLGRTRPIERVGLRGFDQTIVTSLRARDSDRLDVDVLIRADGTRWPLAVGLTPNGDRGAVVVDFVDRADAEAFDAARQRHQHYLDSGFCIHGD